MDAKVLGLTLGQFKKSKIALGISGAVLTGVAALSSVVIENFDEIAKDATDEKIDRKSTRLNSSH